MFFAAFGPLSHTWLFLQIGGPFVAVLITSALLFLGSITGPVDFLETPTSQRQLGASNIFTKESTHYNGPRSETDVPATFEMKQ